MQVWAACSFSVTHSHTPPFASPFLSPSPSLSFSSRSCLFSTVIAFYFVRLVPRLCPSFVWWLALSRSLLLCWCYRTHLIRHLDRYRCSNTPFIVYFGNSLLGFCQDLSVVVVVVPVDYRNIRSLFFEFPGQISFRFPCLGVVSAWRYVSGGTMQKLHKSSQPGVNLLLQ